MKKPTMLLGTAALAAMLAAGCGHLDFTPAGDPNRVLTGTVTFQNPTTLPPDAEVLVRVVDPHPQSANANSGVLPSPDRLPMLNQPPSAVVASAPGPETLGEQTIRNPGSSPVAFRVEYVADDDLLRRGLSIEVRIKYGGRIQLSNNMEQYAVTLNDVADPHVIEAEAIR